ncbi:hypothetical protein AMAG_08984 [Allomyces macrogynus ATCC 38327]|uniref:G-protein coupled receptors family 3 profile domain-containing protein n=1 Tax=Allomyces macrogynus (strain ATCC 38327) TaxID=578462 RepID=A0A0L0SN06_ALLM3|nr:hypothetical protein, variant [Allomyces macrogynus ATCC 38327]KNE63926.1 hypothetical protein AMAG_08984 [Allomyces macrogynus ATCC 38327]|eukprot:KNE63925.1 hypothetical protein, variant [Allomyces macrogynus ATCC 38327]
MPTHEAVHDDYNASGPRHHRRCELALTRTQRRDSRRVRSAWSTLFVIVVIVSAGVGFLAATAHALRVRLLSGRVSSVWATSPYLRLALDGCDRVANTNPSVTCGTSGVDGSGNTTSIANAINGIVTSTNDDLFFSTGSWGTPEAMDLVAMLNPTKSFVMIDSVPSRTLPNLAGVTFAEDQAGFLAGALAAVFSQVKKIGVIGGRPSAPVKKYVNGYLNGALSLCPTCEIYNTYVPSFSNATLGQAASAMLLAQGVDVIFGAGGTMGSAGILSAAQQQTFVIGVDSDEAQTTFLGRQAIDYLLGSSIKNVDVAVSSAINNVLGGRMGGYNLVLDSSLKGVGLSALNSTALKNFNTSVTVSIKSATDMCATTSFYSRASVLTVIRNLLEDRMLFTKVLPSGNMEPLTAFTPKTWYDVAPFGARSKVPNGLQGHSAFMLPTSNQVLVWGGKTAISEFPQHVSVLDYDSLTWRADSPASSSAVPLGRMFHAAAITQHAGASVMYVFGGQGDNAAIFADTWRYNVATKTWTLLAPITAPSNRTDSAYATVGTTLYLFGGLSPSGEVLSDLWALDLTSEQWAQVPTFGTAPGARRHAAMTAVNGTKLTLFGGTDGDRNPMSKLHVLDTTTRTWTHVYPGGDVEPPAAERIGAVTLDDKRVLYTGGVGAGGSLNSTWVWKMHTNQWVVASQDTGYGPLPAGLHSHAMVIFNQSASPTACQSQTVPGFSICTPATLPVVLAISGVASNPGGGVLVSYASAEPPLPAPGVIDQGAKIAVTVINAVGLVGVLGVMGVLLTHRSHKVVKASNWKYGVVILLGSLVISLGIIATSWVPDSRQGVMVVAYMISSGFDLIFSALVVKTNIIYTIFSSRQAVRTSHWQHYGFIVLVQVVQFVIVGLWFVFDDNPTRTLSLGGVAWVVRTININWVVLTAVPIAGLTVAGLVLSFKTRHVESRFNEGVHISTAMYLFAFSLVVVAPVALILDSPFVVYIITSLLITLTNFGVIGIYFGPKLMAIFSPPPENVLSGGTAAPSTAGVNTADSTESGGESSNVLRCKYCKQQVGTTATGSTSSGSATVRAGAAPRSSSSSSKRARLRIKSATLGSAPASSTPR